MAGIQMEPCYVDEISVCIAEKRTRYPEHISYADHSYVQPKVNETDQPCYSINNSDI